MWTIRSLTSYRAIERVPDVESWVTSYLMRLRFALELADAQCVPGRRWWLAESLRWW